MFEYEYKLESLILATPSKKKCSLKGLIYDFMIFPSLLKKGHTLNSNLYLTVGIGEG